MLQAVSVLYSQLGFLSPLMNLGAIFNDFSTAGLGAEPFVLTRNVQAEMKLLPPN